MFRSGSKSFGRGRGGTSKTVTKAPLKGLFSDGIWKCNCDPRLPAQHFETKNGGKNHGRWFYTCQLPQPKRCDFFLWGDEAKGREAAAVLNNSRTESGLSPVTPTKASQHGLPTPETERRVRYLDSSDVQTPYTPSKPARSAPPSTVRARGKTIDTQGTTTTAGSSEEEFYEWPASDDEEMGKVADQAWSEESSMHTAPMLPPETPRKALKSDSLSTPSKRRYEEMAEVDGYAAAWPTPKTDPKGDRDVFTTPSTSVRGNLFADPALLIPGETPTPLRYRDIPPAQETELATEILVSLQTSLSAPLYAEARENIKNICNRHVMYTKGILKGRDVSRAMVKKKEEQIVELQNEIEGLKTERETNRAVVRHLRRENSIRREAA